MPDRPSTEIILAALHKESRLGPHFRPEVVAFAPDGSLILQGDVADVAQKKLALRLAAALPGVTGVVDRLRVTRGERVSDAGIRARLRRDFSAEPAFAGFALREAERPTTPPEFVQVAGDPATARGRIDVEVRDGVVILNGEVPGLVSKRLAGALAWWAPGVRDVVNGLEPVPPEEDAPIRIEEAVRAVLDRDPMIDAAQLRVGVRHTTVRLTGLLRNAAHRRIAVADAWSVLGVDEVIDEIQTAP
ncbi:BON domain-containing protein [Palleronia sp. KMU-117]|uniref:BON domain-containing protein n=1 Tax=Palleronia sp. KMU-117 TaxID=3434108 RepID=UPI003D7466ED